MKLVLAISISVIGILLLYLVTPDVSPQFLSIEGEIKSVREHSGVVFINFVPENFTVVSFKDLELEKGPVVLHGRLQEYKGRVEFVVER